MVFLISFISGTMQALAGVGYRLTTMGKGNVLQSSAALGLCGLIVYGLIAAFTGGWQTASWQLIVIAAGVGICQYIGMIAFRRAMKSGTLSLVWCATSLQFMPAVIFATVHYQEPFTLFYFLALICVVAAIVSASFGGRTKKTEPGQRRSVKGKIFFGFLLVALMICFSTTMTALKICKYMDMLNGGADYVFYSVLYGAFMVCCAGDMIYFKTWTSNLKCWVGMGLNSMGSLVAFGLMLLLLAEPATITFALPNTISILLASIISTMFLRERRYASWYATLAFSIAAIILMVV